MLYEFLENNQEEILAIATKKILNLSGLSPSSDLLERAIPIFYNQLKGMILLQQQTSSNTLNTKNKDEDASAIREAELAKEAERYGVELQRLDYTLSHVVYVYGSLCQSITELASEKNISITSEEFKNMNKCLDIAIASAVGGHEIARATKENKREVERLGFMAHELRNALASVNISLQLIKKGSVDFNGTTGQVLGRSLKRIEKIIDRSLAEVRLRANPKLRTEKIYLLQIVDQIVMTTTIEAESKNQSIEVRIDPSLIIEVDQEMLFSAISNLVQNALRHTRTGGKIQVRGYQEAEHIIIEVEDECGGLPNPDVDLFKPFEQQHENRKGLGLGLTIAKQAIELNQGTIGVINLPDKGCIFKISLPKMDAQIKLKESPLKNNAYQSSL